MRHLLLALSLCLAAIGAAQRPETLQLVPGVVEIRSVVYDPGTPAEASQPASGTGQLFFKVKGLDIPGPEGVKFTGLLLNADGTLNGLSYTLERAFVLEPQGADLKLELPAGKTDFIRPNKLAFTGSAKLSTPYRSQNGDTIILAAKEIQGTATQAGTGDLELKGVTLQGTALNNGLTVPGMRIKAPSLDFKLAWTNSEIQTWELKIPNGSLEADLPGLPASPQYPLTADVTNLTLDQNGTVNCPDALIKVKDGIGLPELAGFKLTIKSGRLRVVDSEPQITGLEVEVTLPPELTEQPTHQPGQSTPPGQPIQRPPVKLPKTVPGPQVRVQVENGVTIEILSQVTLYVKGTKILVDRTFIDLSSSLSPVGTGVPDPLKSGPWQGVWLVSGKVSLPLEQAPEISYRDFVIDSTGLSGTATATGLNLNLNGTTVNDATVEVSFLQNRMISGSGSGKLNVKNFGSADCQISVTDTGDNRIALANGNFKFEELGLKMENVEASMDRQGLILSGDLMFDQGTPGFARISASIPDELKAARFSMSGMRIVPDGTLMLPRSGSLTLGRPLTVAAGPFMANVRYIGFTADNRGISSVTLSGGGALDAMEGFPLSGEIKFEGFTVARGPTFSVGGVEVSGEVLEIGSISASLYVTDDLPGFPNQKVLYGAAELNLTALGAGSGPGIGLNFLVSKGTPGRPPAFFVGGEAAIFPPIKVTVPAAGGAPVPIFDINGFSGGFGLNVLPISEGQGRISEPDRQLKYNTSGGIFAQAGLLVSDPATSGRVWWADASLTFTINPIVLDLTARMAFLTGQPAEFMTLSEWEELDRIARVYMNLNLSAGRFMIGGDADLSFPSRSTNLLGIQGEAELLINSDGATIYAGWPNGGQDPLTITVAQAIRDVVRLEGQAGFGVDIRRSGTSVITSGGAFFLLSAEANLGPATFNGSLQGVLELQNIGSSTFRAAGQLSLDGRVDFGFFEASANASITASIDTKLRMSGRVTGKAGPFSGTADFGPYVF